MRTTVTLAKDVALAVERVRRERGLGVSGAINALIREGLAKTPERQQFVQRTSDGGAIVDVTNVAEALDFLEGPAAR
ncbi:MAG: CopG family transcriptional regulator [Actinomycetota bacterium]